MMLAACSGQAAAPEEEAPAPAAPVSKHVGTVEQPAPKSKRTAEQTYPKSKHVLREKAAPEVGHADPATVPNGEATEPAPAAADTVAFQPHRSVHVVQPGDTLESIAKDNGWGSWTDVAAYNNIRAPYVLFEDQRISEPVKGGASAAPAGLTLTPASVTEPADVTPAALQDPAPVPAPVQQSPAPQEQSPATDTRQGPKHRADEPAVSAETDAVVAAAPTETPRHRAPEPEAEAPVTVAPATPVAEVPAIQEPAAPAPAAGSTAFALRSLELINEYRAANGVHALTYDPALENLAVTWAGSQKEAINARGWEGVAHNPNLASELPDGWSNYAENIAVNHTPETMMQWWKNSPSHNAAMLSPALDAFGFGSAELDPNSWLAGNHVGVQVFARY